MGSEQEIAEGAEIDFSLPVLCVRQPWAHAIVAGGKDVENRSRRTKYRGPVLIHAGKACGYRELANMALVNQINGSDVKFADLNFGGIVGVADIVDCVDRSDSPWFVGPFGFVLRNARPLPFFPCKGKLGFFKVGGRN